MHTSPSSYRIVLIGAFAAALGSAAAAERASNAGAEPGFVMSVLASGSKISGANGIHFGPDGMLYVASVVGSELIVMNPNDGTVVRRFTAKDGVEGPDDVAFAPDGSYYWTSILTGEVAGFRPDGTRVSAAKLSPGVNPLTFSDDGRLFVGQCFFGTGLYEVDPNGIKPPRSIRDDLGPGCGMNGMDWGPDGRLYGARWFKGEAVSLNPDTGEMRTAAAGIQVPAAVKFDHRGRLHVLDTMAGQVVRIDGTNKTVVAQLEPGLDNFAFDAHDRLFVSSYADGFVAEVMSDGSLRLLSPAGMSSPGGVAVRGNEVVVADLHAVRGFDAASGKPTFVQRNILGVSKLGSSTNVAIDGDNFVLASWVDDDARVWDPRAQVVVEQYKELKDPVSAVRFQGRLLVAEHGTHSVTARHGDQVETITDQLHEPTDLLVRGDDVFVTDRVAGTLSQLIAGGRTLAPPKVVVSGLDAPEGVAAYRDGFAIVEAGSGALTLVDAQGSRTKAATLPVGEPAGSAAQPPSFILNGVAVLSDGSLVLNDERNRRLVKVAALR